MKLARAKRAAAPRAVAVRALTPPAPGAVERALGEMASRIAEASRGPEAERALLGTVQALLQTKAAFVLRKSSEQDLLKVSMVRGRNDPRIAAVQPGEGPAGRAFSEGAQVEEGGVVAVPLLVGARPEGCLVLLAPRHAVSEELGRALAAQLAAASEVSRLTDVAARRTKDLETAVAGLKSLERAREELLADVSHELKNPLSTIKMNLALLARPELGELNERQKRAVNTSERNADRLLRLINDLLLISRLKAGDMQLSQRPFGLKALADEAMRNLTPVGSDAKVPVTFRPSPEVYVLGDRDHLREAISHLLEGAIYRSDPGSEVELRIEVAESGLARLSVVDHGPELPEAELAHLFETFRPGGHRGATELALPIAARIIRLHGGRIEASSRDGLALEVFLPMFAGALSQASAEAAPRSGGILLVEDDRDCREVLQEVLELEGYRVIAATSATEARTILEQLRPALVLLDLRLSQEDGMSVLHFIRRSPALAEIAVYIISGARDVASLSSGEGPDRIDGFFEKPLQVPKVLDTIAQVVRRAQPGSR